MSQPNWKLVGTVGDINPLDYSGGFIFEDTTGVYAPEVEYIDAPDDDNGKWRVYRFEVPKLKTVPRICPELSGYRKAHNLPAWTHPCLVTSRYDASFPHPSDDYDEWFNTGDTCNAQALAEQWELTIDEWQAMFCVDDICTRAQAYLEVAQYAGLENMDSDPLVFTSRKEIEARYVGKTQS